MPQNRSKRRKTRDSSGAVFCEQHNRRECAKNTKQGVRCHRIAFEGLDACKLHCGETVEKAKARGQANLLAQAFVAISPDEYADPADVLYWAMTRAYLRSLWISAELRAAGEQGKTIADETVRVLVELEQLEAREAARVSKMALDVGLDERRVKVAESVAGQIVAVVRGVVAALGHDVNDPKVQEVCRKQLTLISGGAA